MNDEVLISRILFGSLIIALIVVSVKFAWATKKGGEGGGGSFTAPGDNNFDSSTAVFYVPRGYNTLEYWLVGGGGGGGNCPENSKGGGGGGGGEYVYGTAQVLEGDQILLEKGKGGVGGAISATASTLQINRDGVGGNILNVTAFPGLNGSSGLVGTGGDGGQRISNPYTGGAGGVFQTNGGNGDTIALEGGITRKGGGGGGGGKNNTNGGGGNGGNGGGNNILPFSNGNGGEGNTNSGDNFPGLMGLGFGGGGGGCTNSVGLQALDSLGRPGKDGFWKIILKNI